MRIMRLEGIVAKRREASLGSRAFSGVSAGPVGSLVGVHWSLGLSALIMLAIASALRPTLHQAERGSGQGRRQLGVVTSCSLVTTCLDIGPTTVGLDREQPCAHD